VQPTPHGAQAKNAWSPAAPLTGGSVRTSLIGLEQFGQRELEDDAVMTL
jgi:hypothetical protein